MSDADLDVTVERIGGLTGRATVVARYGTADLPEREAARIRAAVESLAAAGGAGAAGGLGAPRPREPGGGGGAGAAP
ncbi:hypothetical protein, partial [Spirillospora sp. NPDC029432]|uniref:hypothetical protein n=1 Tax=Spirillospora sp. NPDC029432 TaxID=3154599 RepID=UPI0034559088